jgi:methionyl-tRNA formyltransferase
MRVVFFGTPEFAVPTLDALLAAPGVIVAAVVTQPDRPRTRSHSTLLPSPVKARAAALGIPVWQPERPRGDDFLAQLRALDADLGVVVAYGHILRPEVLDTPRLGMLNVHASLLPRWRGAAPIHWAILSGDRETGVSIMQMDPGLDAGPVWRRATTPIADHDTTGALFSRLASLGAATLVETLPLLSSGARAVAQEEAGVTLAPKVDRAQARIRWDRPRREVSCLIRAMDPFPGAWCEFGGEPIKLFSPELPRHRDEPPSAPTGTISVSQDMLEVTCIDGPLVIGAVQPAGRRRMAAAEWLHGAALGSDARFD